jgi:hypothetical protein
MALSETMHKRFTKEEIFQLISNIHEFEKVEISEKGVAYSLLLSNGEKTIEISWPYEFTEVFLCYFQGTKSVFEDWFECLEQEPLESFIEYIKIVSIRYLKNETRIKSKGLLFLRKELQYFNGSSWNNVLHNPST